MTKEIIASTIPNQLEKLKIKGLLISDEPFATEALEIYGYYNVINSYKEPYILINKNEQKHFKPGTTFEQIFSLFQLDHQLRNSVMVAMIDLEEHLRAIAANVISSSFGTNIEIYLNRTNYQNRKIKDPRFSLDRILASLRNVALANNANPIKYYREKYSNVPPWILFKGIFFNTLVNYIRLFKTDEKDRMIHTVFGIRDNLPIENGVKNLFISTLFLFLDYRNLTAHGGRVYNYCPKNTLFLSEQDIKELELFIQNPRVAVHKPGVEQLLFSLQLYRYKSPFNNVIKTLNAELTRHCNDYPNDISFIENITGITVSKSPTVWISNNSKIYHKSPNCGHSKNLYNIAFEDAKKSGFIPCKKCCNN